MDVEWDNFIIAGFALWAGDFDYFERLLKEFSPPSKSPHSIGKILSADDLVRATGALRRRQYVQKKREFAKMVKAYENAEIRYQPETLQTTNLRATIWRVGVREFVMYAYLTNLDYAEELFSRAQRMADPLPAAEVPATEVTEKSGLRRKQRKKQDLNPEALKQFEPPGAAWTVEGNPFIQVELTDMGLVRVKALWTKRSLPDAGNQITGSLYHVLTELDRSTIQKDQMKGSTELNKRL